MAWGTRHDFFFLCRSGRSIRGCRLRKFGRRKTNEILSEVKDIDKVAKEHVAENEVICRDEEKRALLDFLDAWLNLCCCSCCKSRWPDQSLWRVICRAFLALSINKAAWWSVWRLGDTKIRKERKRDKEREERTRYARRESSLCRDMWRRLNSLSNALNGRKAPP
ncbi:hypothetical protein BCR43DRAFT_112143 [Syncephalastrum racemosum]|uniref:Uncharacterized protein n=1 Tax=Syncephalastrum racemosum TaxID=13706 RepID=A0A1X2H036_SYNRA|nr:hypothetical protein BCR43DRAFT_112143 [Syncephalastrum racemosum]